LNKAIDYQTMWSEVTALACVVGYQSSIHVRMPFVLHSTIARSYQLPTRIMMAREYALWSLKAAAEKKSLSLLLGDTCHVLGKQVQRGYDIVTHLNLYDISIVYKMDSSKS
jgi:hypothetical protein